MSFLDDYVSLKKDYSEKEYLMLLSKVGYYIDFEELNVKSKIVISEAFLLSLLNKRINNNILEQYPIKIKEYTEDEFNKIHLNLLEKIIWYKNEFYINKELLEGVKSQNEVKIDQTILNPLYLGIFNNTIFNIDIDSLPLSFVELIKHKEMVQATYIKLNFDDYLDGLNSLVNIKKNILKLNNSKLVLDLYLNYDDTKQKIVINNKNNLHNNITNFDNELIIEILNDDIERINFVKELGISINYERLDFNERLFKHLSIETIINKNLIKKVIDSNISDQEKINILKEINRKLSKSIDYNRLSGCYFSVKELLIKKLGSYFGYAIEKGYYELALLIYKNNLINPSEVLYSGGAYESVIDILEYNLNAIKNTDLDNIIHLIKNKELVKYKDKFESIYQKLKDNGFKRFIDFNHNEYDLFILNEPIKYKLDIKSPKFLFKKDQIRVLLFFNILIESIINNEIVKVLRIINKDPWLLNTSLDNLKWYHFVLYFDKDHFFVNLLNDIDMNFLKEEFWVETAKSDKAFYYYVKIMEIFENEHLMDVLTNSNILENIMNVNIPLYEMLKDQLKINKVLNNELLNSKAIKYLGLDMNSSNSLNFKSDKKTEKIISIINNINNGN